MTTLYYYHSDFLQHDTGLGHPESPDRLSHINAALDQPEFNTLRRITPQLRADVMEHIRRIHSQPMIDKALQVVAPDSYVVLDSDTILSAGSANAALLAVSSVCDAVDKIVAKTANNAFCAVRPPGHHAEATHSMGFCLFNNVAIGVEFARQVHQIKRIAIVDFDVHHGNGTQSAFYQQADVFYASTHQMPHYPGTGAPSETGVGNILNVPLSSGDDGLQFREKYQRKILPALKQFDPDFIFLSAGFDAHKDDPLADTQLVDADYQWLTREIVGIAKRCCQGRIISVLEGGYHLYALEDCVSVHIAELMKA